MTLPDGVVDCQPMETEPTYTASEWRKKTEAAWDAEYGHAPHLARVLDKLCPRPKKKKVRVIVELPEAEDVNFWRRQIGRPFAGGTDSTIVAVGEVDG